MKNSLHTRHLTPPPSRGLGGLCLVGLFLLLFLLDLCSGSVWISLWDMTEIEQYIFTSLRLPKALTAVLAGAALSVSGAMMQTLFRNPLAGPYILGVSSGASLGVALITMAAGLFGVVAHSGGIVLSAVLGAAAVLLLVMALARKIENNVTLLIVGMLVGSIAGALVNLIQNYANPDALKLFIVWSLGSLSSVGWSQLPVLAAVVAVGLSLALFLMKPLNGLMLGENYARGLGIAVERVRFLIVLSTGLLAGAITAFCGPIAFIGVAVPHLARGLFGTSNHRQILPACALIGADMLLVCDILSSLSTYPLPISTVSALFGAPVVIWVLIKR